MNQEVTKDNNFQNHAAPCNSCSNIVYISSKNFRGKLLCQTCYSIQIKIKSCSKCNRKTKAYRHDKNPTCNTCKRSNRACFRCKKPIAKAGLILNGLAICKACAPHFRKPRDCVRCGNKSTRLSRISGIIDDPVCEKCQRQLTCSTCHHCRKHRRTYYIDSTGRASCKTCTENPGIVHACPQCGLDVPGNGVSHCKPCYLAIALRKKAHALSTQFRNKHIVQIWLAFPEWIITNEKTLKALGILHNHAEILAKIDKSIKPEQKLSDTILASTLTAEDVRTSGILAQYMIHDGILTSNNIQRKEWSEKNRISMMLVEASHYPWSNHIENYLTHLNTRKRKISLKTQIVYLRAAIELMKYSALDNINQLTNNTLDRFIRLQPGYRASLSTWLTFLMDKYEIKIQITQHKKTNKTKHPEKETKALLVSFQATNSMKAKYSILAKLLSLLYSIPMEKILHLHVTDIIDNEGIQLNLQGSWIKIDKRIEPMVRLLLIDNIPSGQLHVFPGRLFGDTLSVDAAKYYFATLKSL